MTNRQFFSYRIGSPKLAGIVWLDFSQDANEFRNFINNLVAAKLRFPMHRYYSSRVNQLYESCNTARAAGRPAIIQLDAHSGHDSSKFINFANLSDVHFRDEISSFFMTSRRNLGAARNSYINFLEDGSMTNRNLFSYRIGSLKLTGFERLDFS